MFRGYTGISLSVRPCVCTSVCVQNTIFCHSTGGGIKSHLVTALVFIQIIHEKQDKQMLASLNRKVYWAQLTG